MNTWPDTDYGAIARYSRTLPLRLAKTRRIYRNELMSFQRFIRFCSATGLAYIATRPSKKSVQRMLLSIHEQTARSRTLRTAEEVVLGINRALMG